MKIFYITSCFLDSRSVETIHTDAVCRSLASMGGHNVLLFAPNSKEFESETYKINSISTPKIAVSVFFQLRLFFCLCRDIRSNRPDIIYIRNSQLLFIPAIVSKIFRVPSVLEANGKILDEEKQRRLSLLGRVLSALKILRFIESFNVKSAKKIIAVTEGIKEYFVKNYKTLPAKIEVVANGVDIEALKPIESSDVRAQLNLDKDSIYIGYIGSFYSWQGLRYIAKASKIVIGKRPDAKFLIVGNGDERDYLTSFVKNNKLENSIEISPAISHNLVPLYVNAFDICLCYPNKFRAGATSPFKVYEYLACAKPVLLSDIAGMREEFGDTVLYVEPESPEVLAKNIISLIDDKHERERLGKLGRVFVEQGLSWKEVTHKIVEICQLVISVVPA